MMKTIQRKHSFNKWDLWLTDESDETHVLVWLYLRLHAAGNSELFCFTLFTSRVHLQPGVFLVIRNKAR